MGKTSQNMSILLIFIIFFYFPAAVKAINSMPVEKDSSAPWKIHFKSYLHVRYSFIENDAKNKVSADHWSLRRFKFLANWQMDSRAAFCVQAIYKTNNYSSTDNKIYLQHAYLKYFLSAPLNIKIGQFKPPFGWERFQSDFQLPTTERTEAVNRLIPNGSLGKSFVRDYGLEFFSHFAGRMNYEIALMSGNGANNGLSTNNFPLIAARFSYKKNYDFPLLQQKVQFLMQLAYSYRQNENNNFVKQLPGCEKTYFQNFSGEDRRIDYAVTLTSAGNQFAAEYLSAIFSPSSSESSALRACGWFCQYSHFLTDRWQYVLRFEHFDSDRSIKNAHDLSWLTIGVDYYFKNKLNRIMLNYVHKIEAADEMKNDEFVVQLQYFLFGSN